MSKKLSLLAAGLLASLTLTAYAGPNGAGGKHMGGMSADHMSSKGMSNTNGPDSADRDKGLARADERRSDSAAMHEKADTAQAEHKKPHGKKNR
ncbi:MAG TPA: hypothetical protein VJ576_17455 [Rhodocyclaceae bacterium]|nr:hypothetical protein [Rhodocyclaceae bacterium]